MRVTDELPKHNMSSKPKTKPQLRMRCRQGDTHAQRMGMLILENYH